MSISMELGSNIRKHRKRRGVTLRDCAKKVGVSASFLSQVETGRVSPSISTLKKISDALNTTIAILIGKSEEDEGPIVRADKRRQIQDNGDGMSISFLTSQSPEKLMEPVIVKLEDNENNVEIRYQHFGQEFILVLKGAIEIIVGNDKYQLQKGDSMYFNSGVPHAFWSIKGDSEVLSINAPPDF